MGVCQRSFVKIASIFIIILNQVTISQAQIQTGVVEKPESGTNHSYVNFRAPLVEVPLLKLPVGSIQPKGWFKKYLELQREGLNGKLGSISAWLDKENNQWLSDTGDHGWEELPYWLRGYSSLAYILDDEEMKDEAQIWFDAVLSNLKPDGFLGPRNFENGNPELWAQMVMLWALQTYYEKTQDDRVLHAMTDYFKWEMEVDDSQFLKGYWQEKRGGDNLWSVIWLYNRTGDENILPLIEKLHRNTSDWTLTDTLPDWHGVNVAQGFREPATYYIYTGDKNMLQHTYDNFNIMRERFGQVPGGMYGADENARLGYSDPRQGAETCAIVEHMASDEILMGITGDPFWAEHCETLAFNTFPAALTEDMKALRYITSPNMAISDEKLHGPSIDNNLRGMLSMSPFSSRCCQHNHGIGWPYYAEHLVMATTDNGLATMLYSESETTAKVADGKTVVLKQTTNYPFDETIVFTISTNESVHFPLYLRIPAWTKNPEVTVNGDKVNNNGGEGKYIKIDKEWEDGDEIVLRFPMHLSVDTWTSNKDSKSLNYGPLTLSLLINEEYEMHDSRDLNFVQDDSHWQQGVDASLWPSYIIRPKSDWNYSLLLDENDNPINFSKKEGRELVADEIPFTVENVPWVFTATGLKIPSWGYDETGITDILPEKSAEREEKKEEIKLIPMGAARLRISAFPPTFEK